MYVRDFHGSCSPTTSGNIYVVNTGCHSECTPYSTHFSRAAIIGYGNVCTKIKAMFQSHIVHSYMVSTHANYILNIMNITVR